MNEDIMRIFSILMMTHLINVLHHFTSENYIIAFKITIKILLFLETHKKGKRLKNS